MFNFVNSQTGSQRQPQHDQSTLDQKDLTITSDAQNQQDEEFCQGQLFKYIPPKLTLSQDIYPDIFPQYPKTLVKQFNLFIKPFVRHQVTKLMNYELNMTFLICQLSYKLGKISKYYENDQKMNKSFKMFQFYLKLHSISNTFMLSEMVEVLIDEKSVNENWQLNKKKAFNDIKSNNSNLINVDQAIQVLKYIDHFHESIIKKCSKLKHHHNYVPINFSKINMYLFNNDQCALSLRQKLIGKPQQNFFNKIQTHFQDSEIQHKINSSTKNYLKSFYKQIYLFYQKNSSDKNLNQLLYLIIVAKLNSPDLPFWILRYIQKEKKNIATTSKILKAQNFAEYIVQSNIYFIAQLPKIYLLLKKRGFMKLSSFLNETDNNQIQQEIVWLSKAFKKPS